MFSTLGPMFKTVFRQAEHADTRHEIRREEKENGGKKKNPHEDEDAFNALWEDSTTVSVEALRTFLLEFLKNQGGEGAFARASQTSEVIEPTEEKPFVSPVAAQAVKAYTSMASQPSYNPQHPPVAEKPESGNQFRSEEVRTIHALIVELNTLENKGLQMVTIQIGNGSFIDAVVAGVRAAASTV